MTEENIKFICLTCNHTYKKIPCYLNFWHSINNCHICHNDRNSPKCKACNTLPFCPSCIPYKGHADFYSSNVLCISCNAKTIFTCCLCKVPKCDGFFRSCISDGDIYWRGVVNDELSVINSCVCSNCIRVAAAFSNFNNGKTSDRDVKIAYGFAYKRLIKDVLNKKLAMYNTHDKLFTANIANYMYKIIHAKY